MIPVEDVHKAIVATAGSGGGEDEQVKALVAMGMAENEALFAFRFTQVAWARFILLKLNVKLVDDYVIFNEAGKIGERGKLSEQSWFAAATREAGRFAPLAEFQKIAAGSSEFDAVNKALLNGSKAENLMMTPVFMFPPKISDKALNAAMLIYATEIEMLKQRARAQQKGVAPAKPWWKIW